MSKHTRLCRNTLMIIFNAVTCPPIHNIVVVTSPIGDHAPPALAAMMIMPVNFNLSSLSFNNFLISDIITIVVVRLSKIAERKKLRKQMIHNNSFLLSVVMREVITSNPLCPSISSTIVMAPNRKNKIPDALARCSNKWLLISVESCPLKTNNIQQSAAVMSADAPLLILIKFSGNGYIARYKYDQD